MKAEYMKPDVEYVDLLQKEDIAEIISGGFEEGTGNPEWD